MWSATPLSLLLLRSPAPLGRRTSWRSRCCCWRCWRRRQRTSRACGPPAWPPWCSSLRTLSTPACEPAAALACGGAARRGGSSGRLPLLLLAGLAAARTGLGSCRRCARSCCRMPIALLDGLRSPPLCTCVPCRYQVLREKLLGGALLLFSAFLGSLSAPPQAGASGGLLQPAHACPAPVLEDGAPGSCAAAAPPPSSDAVLAGFGLCWFLLHACGLHYLAAAPLLMRVSARGERSGRPARCCLHLVLSDAPSWALVSSVPALTSLDCVRLPAAPPPHPATCSCAHAPRCRCS